MFNQNLIKMQKKNLVVPDTRLHKESVCPEEYIPVSISLYVIFYNFAKVNLSWRERYNWISDILAAKPFNSE